MTTLPVPETNPVSDVEKQKKSYHIGMASTIMTIMKQTIGAGILFLPKTFAAAGYGFGTAAILFTTFITSYSMYFLGVSCEILGENNIIDMTTSAIGAKYGIKWKKTVANVFLLCLMGHLFMLQMCYLKGAGNFGSKILCLVSDKYAVRKTTFEGSTDAEKLANKEAWIAQQNEGGELFWTDDYKLITSIVAALILVGVTQVKYLSNLKISSYIGNFAILCLFALIIAKGATDLAGEPSNRLGPAAGFGPSTMLNVLALLPMSNGALTCHFNGPVFYDSLANKDQWGSTVGVAMGGMGVFYAVFAALATYSFGYDKDMDSMCLNCVLEFGRLGEGSHVWHWVAMSIVALMTLSIMGTFALVFVSFRNFVQQFLESNEFIAPAAKDASGLTHTTTRRRFMTFVCMTIITIVSCLDVDVSLPFALSNSTIGCFDCFYVPAVVFWIAKGDSKTVFDRVVAIMVFFWGFSISVGGIFNIAYN